MSEGGVVDRFIERQGGWYTFLMFDLGTVAISILDVVSDIIVIRQFYIDGHRTFFAISLSILVLSSGVFTLMLLVLGLGNENNRSWSIHTYVQKITKRKSLTCMIYLGIFICLVPGGQAYPVVMWAMETFWPAHGKRPTQQIRSDGEEQADNRLTDAQIDIALQEGRLTAAEAAEQKKANFLARWQENSDPLRDYLKRQIAKHAPFLAETITESVPQSLVQLTALIMVGKSDSFGVSVLSICLSIVSILSKSYIVSLSMTRPIFKFKMLLICYDVVALFYTFTCLFLEDQDSSNAVFMPLFGRKVDILSCTWLWGAIVASIWFMLLFFWIGVNGFVEDWKKIGRSHYRRQRGCEERQALVFAAITCLVAAAVMWVPLMIVLLSMNLAWGIIWLQDSEDSFLDADYPFYAKVLRFLHGRDFALKLQCANLVTCRESLIHVANITNAQKFRNIVKACERDDFSLLALVVGRKTMQRVPHDMARQRLQKFNREPLGMGANMTAAAKSRPCFRAKKLLVWFLALCTTALYSFVSFYGLLYPFLTLGRTLSRHFDERSSVDITHGAYAFQVILFVTNVLILSWILSLARPGGVVPLYMRALWHLQPLQRKHGSFSSAAEWHQHLYSQIECQYARRSGRALCDIEMEVEEQAEKEEARQACGGRFVECMSKWSR